MRGHVEGLVSRALPHAHELIRRLGVGAERSQLPLVHPPECGHVVIGRPAAEHATKRKREPPVRVGSGRHGLVSQHASRLRPGWVVQRREGVQRRAGTAGPHAACLPIGHVEHVGRVHRPPPEGVEAATIEVAAMRRRIGEVAFLRDRQRLPDLVRLVGIDRLAPKPPVEQAAGRQRPIAKHHRRHPKPAGPREETVLRILGKVVCGHLAGLPVGRTRDEEPMHLLLTPAPIAKLHRQPVEQRQMGGILALHSHVFGRLHDPGAEEVLPHPIHLHTGCQRMLRQEEPLGQPEPVGRGTSRQRRQERWRGKRKRVTLGREIVAAVEDLRLPWIGVAHHHHAGQLVSLVVVESLLGGFILHNLRQILDDIRLHLGVEVTAELVLDRFFVAVGAVLLGLPQQGGQVAGKVFSIGRLTVGKESGLPGGVGSVDHRLGIPLETLHGGLEFREPGLVFLRGEFDDRRRHANPCRETRGRARLRHAVEGVEQRVVVDLCHRIVFMVVALGTGHGEAKPGGARRVDPVEEVVEPLFLGDRAPLAVQEMVAVEAAGDLLIESGLLSGRRRQEISRQLLAGKTIERHVGIEGLHHPVTPDPLPGVAVLLEAIGVGVAGGIEP